MVTGKLDVRAAAAALPEEVEEPEALAADEALADEDDTSDVEAGEAGTDD